MPPALVVLRRRVRAIALKLERSIGIPEPPRTRPAEPMDVLIGTILSQNTNDRNSNRAYRLLRERFPTWNAAARAPRSAIARAIRVGGMADQKSKHIRAVLAAHEPDGYSLRRLDGRTDEEIILELTAHDGVGVKTAACVCLFALGRDVFPVDTHVHRILNRLGVVKASTPHKTFEAMRSLVPRGRAYSFHTNLIRFGRTCCTAQRPACGACPLYADCRWPGRARQRARGGAATALDERATFMVLDHL
jgi:endonuclease-3